MFILLSLVVAISITAIIIALCCLFFPIKKTKSKLELAACTVDWNILIQHQIFVEKDPEIAESSRMHSGSSVTVNRSEDGEEQTEN